jgi:sugar O-acyltransferase (sialic acid O-acetyltransferase NeuD family)
MSKELVIFGTGVIAEVIYYYATEECGFKVAAFAVDEQYKKDEKFLELPVIPFSTIEKLYPPNAYDMFVAVGYHDLNALRENKCKEAIAKGYLLVSIVSPNSHLPKNVEIGYNCFIMPPSIVHPCVKIGNNVFIWNGSVVGHHSHLKDNCWLTSGCNVSGKVTIGENTFIAINATIGHSVTLGKECFIGANTLIIKNALDGQVFIAESTKPLKVNSRQFLRFSNFSSL